MALRDESLQSQLRHWQSWYHTVLQRDDPGRESALARFQQKINEIRTRALLEGIALEE